MLLGGICLGEHWTDDRDWTRRLHLPEQISNSLTKQSLNSDEAITPFNFRLIFRILYSRLAGSSTGTSGESYKIVRELQYSTRAANDCQVGPLSDSFDDSTLQRLANC